MTRTRDPCYLVISYLHVESRDPVLDTDGPLELDDLSRIGSLDSTWVL